MDLYYLQRTIRRLFLVCGCFLRQVLGVCSIRIFAKNMGDPYYELTIVVHDDVPELWKLTPCPHDYQNAPDDQLIINLAWPNVQESMENRNNPDQPEKHLFWRMGSRESSSMPAFTVEWRNLSANMIYSILLATILHGMLWTEVNKSVKLLF